MATEEQENMPDDNFAQIPPDDELFVGNVIEQPSEQDLFAGDEAFYKSMHAKAARNSLLHKYNRFSILQKAILACIILIVAMMACVLLQPASIPSDENIQPIAQIKPQHQHQTTQQYQPQIQPTITQQIQKPEPQFPETLPLSLKVAQNLYLNKDYIMAYAAYKKLAEILPKANKNRLTKDFLQLRMAQCMQNIDDIEKASSILKTIFRSRSPVIRVAANYYLGLVSIQKKQYLKARTRGYQALALIDVIDVDEPWVISLRRDCHFLIAEAITKNVLSLADSDKDIPATMWTKNLQIDPFANITEEQLQATLNSGMGTLSKALLSPQVEKRTSFGIDNQTPSWIVTCHGASIEELLSRFAANTNLDINWGFGANADNVKKRMISLYARATTPAQLISIAAGCAGLSAQIEDEKTISILDPENYSSVSQQTALLSDEAVILWQKFLLASQDNKRIPNAHFALGLLQGQRDQITTAIAEYKLVANRFAQNQLAPYALLHSSKLKTNLHDYAGARKDLKQLIEQYPDAQITDQACLYLADSTEKAGLKEEAARLYRKVYNLSFSTKSQMLAALGTGRCYYDAHDYQLAAKWIIRYIENCPDKTRTNRDYFAAYFLLGKTYMKLGKLPQACKSFKYALKGKLSREQYVETVSQLVKGYTKLDQFVEAIEVLEAINLWQFSSKESIEILLLKSKILRTIGLAEKAIVLIGDKLEYISDPLLKARTSLELTNCYLARGDLERAHKNSTEILAVIEPGPIANEIALTLANVCLKLNRDAQAYSVCLQVLDLQPSPQIKLEALNILAEIYRNQKDYDKAVLALLGKWK
ncbi:MAG: hypothetical protein FVQ80_05915 [Planctomycetes bacterium]|nr:hypothetical protein [Planctomycetota bacterium]